MEQSRQSWKLASGDFPAVEGTFDPSAWEDAVRWLERWLGARAGVAPSRRTSTWTSVAAATATAHPGGVMPPGTFVVHRIVLTAPRASAAPPPETPLAPLDLTTELERSDPGVAALLIEGYGRVRRRGGHLVVLAHAGDDAVCEARIYVPAISESALRGTVELCG